MNPVQTPISPPSAAPAAPELNTVPMAGLQALAAEELREKLERQRIEEEKKAHARFLAD